MLWLAFHQGPLLFHVVVTRVSMVFQWCGVVLPGVVFYQFSRIRLQSQTGSAFLTDDQTEWVELSRLVFRLKPPEKSPVPVNKFRK